MRRARRKMEVDTFPFLAVLLCAMGALILLLMVIDRRSKIVAQNKAYEAYLAHKQSREADIAERDEARKKAEDAERASWQAKKAELERKLQNEHDDLQKQRSSILADIAGLDAKMHDRSEAEKALVRKLADTRAAVTMSQAELDTRQTEIEKTRSEQEGNRRLREEMSQELFRLEAALRTLAERKRTEKPVFSLVPYTGKQGSNRRPIYVELNRDGAIFYPGKQRLTEHEWNPAEFRRMVHERTGNLTAQEQTPSFDNKPAEGPYLLFLVRPDGISGYYAVLDALRGYKVDFGYELVEPDWKFDFAEDKVDALPWRQLTTLDVAPSQVTRPPPKTVSKNWRGPTEKRPRRADVSHGGSRRQRRRRLRRRNGGRAFPASSRSRRPRQQRRRRIFGWRRGRRPGRRRCIDDGIVARRLGESGQRRLGRLPRQWRGRLRTACRRLRQRRRRSGERTGRRRRRGERIARRRSAVAPAFQRSRRRRPETALRPDSTQPTSARRLDPAPVLAAVLEAWRTDCPASPAVGRSFRAHKADRPATATRRHSALAVPAAIRPDPTQPTSARRMAPAAPDPAAAPALRAAAFNPAQQGGSPGNGNSPAAASRTVPAAIQRPTRTLGVAEWRHTAGRVSARQAASPTARSSPAATTAAETARGPAAPIRRIRPATAASDNGGVPGSYGGNGTGNGTAPLGPYAMNPNGSVPNGGVVERPAARTAAYQRQLRNGGVPNGRRPERQLSERWRAEWGRAER